MKVALSPQLLTHLPQIKEKREKTQPSATFELVLVETEQTEPLYVELTLEKTVK